MGVQRLRRRHAFRQSEQVVAAAKKRRQLRDARQRHGGTVAERHEFGVQTARGVQDDDRQSLDLQADLAG